MAVGIQMQHRRATAAVWDTSPKVLAIGELGVTTDTGIIKIGDGVNVWSDLDPAFNSQFLPLLGKAADSDLLDGISASGFIQLGDVTTAATADKVARRLSDGKLKAVAGTASDDVVNLSQMTSAIAAETVSRTVTAAATIAATDVGKMVLVNHSSLTAQVVVTVPTNAAVPMAVGSWIDISAIGNGGVKLTPSGGVTVNGTANVMPNYGLLRLLKTATDVWTGTVLSAGKRLPKVRAIRTASGLTYTSGVEQAIPYNSFDTTQTYNPDNDWFSIPSPDLATARRVTIVKDGEYRLLADWSGNQINQGWIRLYKFSANNTPSTRLAAGITFYTGQVEWGGRLTAGESVGVVHLSSINTQDNADGDFSTQNAFAITRMGD